MVGFPKVIKTKADLVNTYKLVKKGRLKKEDWLAAVEKLENQNFIFCPILEKTEDRKGVTLMFVNEVTEGDKVKAGNVTATVKTVEHIEVEKAAEADQGTAAADAETTTNNNQTKHTILTLSKAIAADAATIGIPAEVTFYDRLGITEEEVEQMKGELV
ncbi:MAG: hypothetical protein ACLRTZ_01935 [Agathobacter sp.]|jgi:hypothetical protein